MILAWVMAVLNFLLSLIGIHKTPPTPPVPPTPGPAPAPLPTGRHLTLVVQTTNVTAQDVAAYLSAQQVQLTRDFAPHWGGSCVIDQQPGGWPVSLLDTSDVQGELGYHDIDASGTPYAKVFVATSAEAGTAWQTVASHEVLEMLADASTHVQDTGPDGCRWYQEVGDPVDDQSYQITGISMSDFALPAWFTIHGLAPFDFLGVLTGDFTVTSGGYAVKVCNGQTVTVGNADRTVTTDRGYRTARVWRERAQPGGPS